MSRIIVLFLLPLLACEAAPADHGTGRRASDECDAALDAFRRAGRTGDAVDAQTATRAVAERPACFEGERVPTSQLRSVVEAAARQTVRNLIAERDGQSAGTTDGQAACDRYAALAGNSKLGIGSDRMRDLADVACAYADAASGSASGYLSALTQVESVRDGELRNEARKDLVLQVYLRRYGVGDVLESDVLYESYPLSGVMDPYAFATDVLVPRLYQSPIPTALFEEQNLDERVRHDLVYFHIVREIVRSNTWETVPGLADAYVARGYDPAFVYRVAYDCVMDAEDDFSLAIRLAAHLGPKERLAAEEARIRQLDAEARYTIAVGPDGRHTRLYPMRDE